MAKEKELSSTDKRRRTTLHKKSVEELVGIILRKDDTERKLNKTIETFKKLQEINDRRISNLKDSLDRSEEIQMSQEKTIASLNATLDAKRERISILEDDGKALYARIKILDNSIKSHNKELHVFFITIVILLMMLIVSVII